jgi:hypothetical protein
MYAYVCICVHMYAYVCEATVLEKTQALEPETADVSRRMQGLLEASEAAKSLLDAATQRAESFRHRAQVVEEAKIIAEQKNKEPGT